MHIQILFYLLSLIGLVITANVEVLNFTFVEDVTYSLSVFNLDKEQSTTETLTVCTWVKLLSDDTYIFAIQENYELVGENYTFIATYIYLDSLIGFIYGHSYESNATYPLQKTWIHVCLRMKNQEMETFLFGEPLSVIYTEDESEEKYYNLSSVIDIGSFRYNGPFESEYQFVGQFYNYNVWKRNLLDTEIKKLAKCPSPKMEGDLVPWSKLINGVKNGDKDLRVHPRVTVLMDEGPCPSAKLQDFSAVNSGSSGNSDPGTSSGENGNFGSSSDQSGNSDPGTSSGGMSDPLSSSDQSGNSDPGASSGGMSDPGSISD